MIRCRASAKRGDTYIAAYVGRVSAASRPRMGEPDNSLSGYGLWPNPTYRIKLSALYASHFMLRYLRRYV